MREKRVWIPSKEIQLEGLLSIPEALPLKGGILLCHPHPQYGGDMHSHVVTVAAETAFEEKFATLRFNFRGVGGSGGSYGEGKGEKEDVLAALDYLSLILQDSDALLFLFGYSFGAWVGFPVAVEDNRVQGMIGIAPPLHMHDFEILKGCKKDKLIIAGSRDSFCPTELLERWYHHLDEPKSLLLIQGADHFFFFHAHSLKPPIREFLSITHGRIS
jgi:alpha/beta superfamily hydrolase